MNEDYEIIIYSTDTCPQCKYLKDNLDKRGIQYKVCSDIDYMQSQGFSSIPVMELRKRMNYSAALKYLEALNEN